MIKPKFMLMHPLHPYRMHIISVDQTYYRKYVYSYLGWNSIYGTNT